MSGHARPSGERRAAWLWVLWGAALLVAGAGAVLVAHDYDAETTELVATLERHRAVHETLVALLDGEAASHALLRGDGARTADDWTALWTEHEHAQAALRASLADVAGAGEVEALEAAVAAREHWTQRLVDVARSGDLAAARELARSGEGDALLAAVRQRLDGLEREEDVRVEALVRSVAVRRTRALGALAGGALVALALAAALFRRAFRDVRTLAARARVAEENERRLRQVADAAVDLVRIQERDGRTVYVSPSAQRLLGRPPDEVARMSEAELVAPDDLPAIRAAIAALERGATPPPVVHRFRRADGALAWFETRLEPIHDDTGALVRWQAASRDVDERVQHERARDERHSLLLLEAEGLREVSATDALTGLLNRRGLLARGEPLLTAERAAGRSTAIVFADIDGLKVVNDQQGHEMGDRLICAAADALRRVARDGDLCARIGGDELVVIARGCDEAGARAFSERLERAIAEGAAERPFRLSLSMGHALASPSSTDSLETVMARADARMYEVKRRRTSRAPSAPAG